MEWISLRSRVLALPVVVMVGDATGEGRRTGLIGVLSGFLYGVKSLGSRLGPFLSLYHCIPGTGPAPFFRVWHPVDRGCVCVEFGNVYVEEYVGVGNLHMYVALRSCR